MSGAPNTPGRAGFGPKMAPVPEIDPTQQIGGARFNLLWWQTAGAGLMMDRAFVSVSSAGLLLACGESWNADQAGPLHPVIAKTGTGVYTVTYPSTAPDENGAIVTLGLVLVTRVAPQSTTPNANGSGSVTVVGSTYVATIQTAVGGTPTNLAFFAAFR